MPALIDIPSIKEDENPTLTLVQEETGKAAVIDDINTDLKNKYEELLKQTLNDIFDKNKPFCATYDNNQCIYCNFSELCNHNNINSENSSSTGNEPN